MTAIGLPSAVALDFSAFARVMLAHARPDSGRRLDQRTLAEFDDELRANRLHATPPFRIETLYSTRAIAEFESMSARLDNFATAEGDANTWLIAERSQRELAEDPAVSHRIGLAGLLLASIASQHGLGVLHYDGDYDLLAEHTSL